MASSSNDIPDGLFDSKEEQRELKRSISNRQDATERRMIRENYRDFMDVLNGKLKKLL